MSDLEDLARRVEALEKRDPHIEFEVWKRFILEAKPHLYRETPDGWEVNRHGTALTPVWSPLTLAMSIAPAYTKSIDAVVGLVNEILPGDATLLLQKAVTETWKKFHHHIAAEKVEHSGHIPRAMLAAAIRTVAAKEPKNFGEGGWEPIGTAPEGVVVETKIHDDGGCRNEARLKLHSNLWWSEDGSMYVYYRPTHWRHLVTEIARVE